VLLDLVAKRDPKTIGVTTVDELEWFYWQRAIDLGLRPSFRPGFRIYRSEAATKLAGQEDRVIRPGDMVPCDKALLDQTNRLQDIFMSEFRLGISGNVLQQNILTRARHEGITSPDHSSGCRGSRRSRCRGARCL
jgi:hypothetical protein